MSDDLLSRIFFESKQEVDEINPLKKLNSYGAFMKYITSRSTVYVGKFFGTILLFLNVNSFLVSVK
jgi:hypothetical protein